MAGIAVDGSLGEEEALGVAAAVRVTRKHTIAQGISATRAVKRNLKLPIEPFEALEGRGVVAAHSDGKMVYVGGPRLLEMRKLELPEKLANSRQKPA